MLRKDPANRIDLKKIYHLEWVCKNQELFVDTSLKLDETMSTFDNTKSFHIRKDSEMNNSSELKTQKMFLSCDVKNKRHTENSIFFKNQNPDNKKIKHQSSCLSIFKDMPSFLENYQVFFSKIYLFLFLP